MEYAEVPVTKITSPFPLRYAVQNPKVPKLDIRKNQLSVSNIIKHLIHMDSIVFNN